MSLKRISDRIRTRSADGPGKPFTDAIVALLREEPHWTKTVAQALFKKAESGDLRAFITLRGVVEGEAKGQQKFPPAEALTAKPGDINVIEARILDLLQRSPQLLAQLDEARQKDRQ